MGPTWGHLGPAGPRWAPCWPHELCYLGSHTYAPIAFRRDLNHWNPYGCRNRSLKIRLPTILLIGTPQYGGRSIQIRADSRLAPSQWEASLQSKAVSHWLGTNPESALQMIITLHTWCYSGRRYLRHLLVIWLKPSLSIEYATKCPLFIVLFETIWFWSSFMHP